MKNYDFDLIRKLVQQTVRLTFQYYDYTAEIEVVVGGNCTGLDVIESATQMAYEDKCPEDQRGVYITMENADRHSFKHYNPDYIATGSYWLKAMLIKAEIIEVKPDNLS